MLLFCQIEEGSDRQVNEKLVKPSELCGVAIAEI